MPSFPSPFTSPSPSERAPLIRLIAALDDELTRLALEEDLRPLLQAALDGARARLAAIGT